MKGRTIGKALENALRKEERKKPKRGGKSPLSSPVRRQIYQYITMHPCAYLSLISRDLLTPIHTLEWHLRKLVQAGYIRERKIGGHRIYFPAMMVEEEHIRALYLLNRENHRLLFRCIISNPGLSLKDCAAKCDLSISSSVSALTDLKKAGLITSVEDGRFRRYFPADDLQDLIDSGDIRGSTFIDWLLTRLSEEGLKPEIIRKSAEAVDISIESQGETESMVVGANPWKATLKSLI